jgi:hypothetical protein
LLIEEIKKLSERNPECAWELKRRISGALKQYKHFLLEKFAGSFNDMVDFIRTYVLVYIQIQLMTLNKEMKNWITYMLLSCVCVKA